MTVNIGDTVRAWKSVMYRDYETEGIVEETQIDQFGDQLAKINGDWYKMVNRLENGFEIIKSTKYRMVEVDILKPVPDNRTYEFGIGNINNVDDPYYAPRYEKTGETRQVELGQCDGCQGWFSRIVLMNASMGTACPDCYDRMSG